MQPRPISVSQVLVNAVLVHIFKFPSTRPIGPYYGLFARHRAEWLVSWACEVFGAILRKTDLRVRNVAANSLGAEC
jgi:hypothetical protein